MKRHETLTEMLEEGRGKNRQIVLIDGESDENKISFSNLWGRARMLLGSMQEHGIQSGDEIVIFTKSNESFLIAFWAGNSCLRAILIGLINPCCARWALELHWHANILGLSCHGGHSKAKSVCTKK